MLCNIFNRRLRAPLAAGALALAPLTLQADQQAMDDKRWNELREKTVSAEELLDAEVQQVGTVMGNVRDLVLNESGTAVKYVLYEVPFPYAFGNRQDGFAVFDNLAIETAGGYDTDLRLDDAAAPQAPEELTLDRRETDDRLVSNILGETLVFADQQTRPVEDLLIDRQSGEVKGYVVNHNEGTWFNDEPRVVAPDQVTIGPEGNVTTRAEFAALETLQ